VCVKNYNSDANNKDVITVDYMVTGGRRKYSICTTKNHRIHLKLVIEFFGQVIKRKWQILVLNRVRVLRSDLLGVPPLPRVLFIASQTKSTLTRQKLD